MTRIVAVNFATPSHMAMRERHNDFMQSTLQVDRVLSYGQEHFSKEFIERGGDVLQKQRGAGYWMWKPFVILQAFEDDPDADWILYSDVASRPRIANREELIAQGQDADIVIGSLHYLEKQFTKRQLFEHFNKTPELFGNACCQIAATVILLRRSDAVIEFVKEWLRLAQLDHGRLICDDPTRANEVAEFVDHRHDQSILSMLVNIVDETRSSSLTSSASVLPKQSVIVKRVSGFFVHHCFG